MPADLRLFRYFVAVAEELHFGRAATRLFVAQPVLSRQIRLLEREIGVELFRRDRRHVSLTEAGAALLPTARRALQIADRAIEDARRAGRGELGHLSIGFVGSAANRMMPELVTAFRERYPEVTLTLDQVLADDLQSNILDGTMDVGISRSRPADQALASEAIATEPYAVALLDTHRLAKRKNLTLETLADEDFIFWPSRHLDENRDYLLHECTKHGFRPRIVQEVASGAGIVSLVAAGLGIAIVPLSHREAALSRLVLVPVRGLMTTYRLIWRKLDTAPVLLRFLESARELRRRSGPSSLSASEVVAARQAQSTEKGPDRRTGLATRRRRPRRVP